LQVRVAKDPSEWNAIVDKSPFSVLHHRYEACVYEDKASPLVVKVGNYQYLFPLKLTTMFKGLKLAFSPVYYYASILPESEEALAYLPDALDCLFEFVQRAEADYFSTCAPFFLSKKYAALIDSWFRERSADVQVAYNHMVHTTNKTFEEIMRSRFEKHAREKVRRAEREGIVIERIDSVEGIRKWFDDIYQCNLSALKRQGREGAFPDSDREVYLSELCMAKKHFGEGFNLYGAIFRGRLVAYMVVQEFNRLMQVTKAMSHTEYLQKCPNDALVAHVIKEGCERGFEWIEYGFDRVRVGDRLPSLHSSIVDFKFKYGFEEVPLFIYRLGLSRSGRMLQHLFSQREHAIAASAYIPAFMRDFLWKLYGPRRRRFFAFLYT